MSITEFAILPFKSPVNLTSDPALQSLFQKLSSWQSDCSGFPLSFFVKSKEAGAHTEIYLVTGWTSVAAHEAWIRGARNQELLGVFAPYVAIEGVRMVHVNVDFEAEPGPKGALRMVVERYAPGVVERGTSVWSLVGRDLGQEDGDIYCFVDASSEHDSDGGLGVLIERWVMERVDPSYGRVEPVTGALS